MPLIEQNFNSQEYYLILSGSEAVSDWGMSGDYIRLSVFDSQNKYIGSFTSGSSLDGIPSHFILHSGSNAEYYISPGEVLDNAYSIIQQRIPNGQYKIKYDFLNNYLSDNTFFVDQISATRKEMRLLVRDTSNPPDSFNVDTAWMNQVKNLIGWVDFRNNTGANESYNFDFVAILPKANNLPIINYGFDDITDPDNPTFVIRFDKSIPSTIKRLDIITIEHERIPTQVEEIYYIAQDIFVTVSDGLAPDTSFDIAYEADTSQSYNQIIQSSTLSDVDIASEVLSSSFKYENLNIDFNEYENHIFFGSAASKLDNFITKAKQIEDHLVVISSSLTITGSSGDISASSVDYNLINRRKDRFIKIQQIRDSFSPYEQFLYSDMQSQTTASAPGTGKNLAYSTAVRQSGSRGQTLLDYEGFNVVYKHSGSKASERTQIDLFSNVYKVENPPFFNTNKPVYLSFLLKGDHGLGTLTHGNTNPNYSTVDTSEGSGSFPGYWNIPVGAMGKSFIEVPGEATASEWRRYIVEASQSYWRPGITTWDNDAYDVDGVNFASTLTAGTTVSSDKTYQILTGSYVYSASVSDGFAYGIKDEAGLHGHLMQPSSMSINGEWPDNSVPRTGSLLPSGELFRIYYNTNNNTATTSSLITDVKVTMNNPTSSLPFSRLYSTGSTAWDDWYLSVSASASDYDENNIHSIYNNLPKNVRDDIENIDLHSFVKMMGEYYDLVRNYVDNYTSLHARKYKEISAVPNNLLPMLGENLGWEFVNTQTGSLADYFNVSSDSGANLKDITNETWRKVLNNLVYIYKTKGTFNSISALLNSYGYPSSFLSLQEIGSTITEQNPVVLTQEIKPDLRGLSRMTGSVSFIKDVKLFYSLNLSGSNKLNLEWQANSATGDGIEFVLRKRGSDTQELLKSSGSSSEQMWDLQVSSSGFVFRLNQTLTGSAMAAASPTITLNPIGGIFTGSGVDRNLWNVYLTRDTNVPRSEATQSYILMAGVQDEDRIKYLAAASMSVSNSAANTNFYSTGSLHYASGSNLVVGSILTGSIAELRMWKNQLSASKFKQHILNKFSIVGNSSYSWQNDRVWHYRLNENYLSGSHPTSCSIFDANANNNTVDYTKVTGLQKYNLNWIDIYRFSTRFGGMDANDNQIYIGNNDKFGKGSILNPKHSAAKTPFDRNTGTVKSSNKISMKHSPNRGINDYIIDQISDQRLSDFMPPQSIYSSSYSELESLRKDILTGVYIDVNKNIRDSKKIINKNIISQVKHILPGRVDPDVLGIIINSDLLHKNKYKHIAPEYFMLGWDGIIDTLPTSSGVLEPERLAELESIYSASGIYISDKYALIDSIQGITGSYLPDNIAEISDIQILSGSYVPVYSYEFTNFITESVTYIPFHSYEFTNIITESAEYVPFYDYDFGSLITQSAEYVPFYDYDFGRLITQSAEYLPSYDYEFSGVVTESAEYLASYDYEFSGLVTESAEYISVYPYEFIDILTESAEYIASYNYEFTNFITHSAEYIPSYNYEFTNFIIQSAEYLPSYDYEFTNFITQSAEYLPSYDYEFNNLVTGSAEYLSIHAYELTDFVTINAEKIKEYSYEFTNLVTESVEYIPPYTYDFDNPISHSAEYLTPYTYEFNSLVTESVEYMPQYAYTISGIITESAEMLTIYDYEFNGLVTGSAYSILPYAYTIDNIFIESAERLTSFDFDFGSLITASAYKFLPYSDTIDVAVTHSAEYLTPYSFLFDQIVTASAYKFLPYSDTIDATITHSAEMLTTYDYEFSGLISQSAHNFSPYSDDIDATVTHSAEYLTPYSFLFDKIITETSEYIQQYAKNIDILTIVSSSKLPIYEYTLSDFITEVGNMQPYYTSSIEFFPNLIDISGEPRLPGILSETMPYYKFSASLGFPTASAQHSPNYIGDVPINNWPDVLDGFIFTYGSKKTHLEVDLSFTAFPSHSASYLPTYDGDLTYLSDRALSSFRDLHKEYKEPHPTVSLTSGSLEFMTPHNHRRFYTSQSISASIALGSPRGPNTPTYHWESRFIFKSIGDIESVSGSLLNGNAFYNHTDNRHYFNRLMSTEHPSYFKEQELNYTYRSYEPFGEASESLTAPQNGDKLGRPIGKTSYYASGSDGTLYYPSNHYSNFSTMKTECPKGIGYEGTQNTDPGFWNTYNNFKKIDATQEIYDYSTGSYYSVSVEEGTQLRVFNPRDKQ